MNLRIVYRKAHGEPTSEQMFTGIGRVREQCGRLELWAEGHELTLHATAFVSLDRVDFYEADCRELDPADAVLFDELLILPDATVRPSVSRLSQVLKAWLRKRLHA